MDPTTRTPASARFLPTVRDPVSSLWHRLRNGTRLLRHEPDWNRLAGDDWPDRVMTDPVTDRLHEKQGRSIGRLILTQGRSRLGVYLKRHYRLGWVRGLLATLFPNRAWSPGLEEWQRLKWARDAGFPVPRAVAAGQYVGPGFRLQGFLAVEELYGMLPLHEAVPLAAERLDAAAFARWKCGLTAELVRLSRRLHDQKWFHKDLYFCHFYVPEDLTRRVPEGWPGRVFMIDLHRLDRHPLRALWFRIKDLGQLLYSSDVAGVTARDRVRFWKLYGGGSLLRRFVTWKWKLYRRNHRRRQSVAPRSAA
ncbi:lipopolysaccharide kinase InaA family protein [Urbifossiella limnaea]|uniref:Lipopolysaccharide core heptose(I) kinase RfaP n=1 Tax=Urbifossiella limnaea TaxID=2528023 RepID=A0A517XY66_9BACT|nr:lipopolysaccharide kinase InaA family protein [Urbifossiella limnaea]QDU22456.1 Lipopolysaccharide core heptose(I) kinase RfaP [Urbifossiella limnaea]